MLEWAELVEITCALVPTTELSSVYRRAKNETKINKEFSLGAMFQALEEIIRNQEN